MSESKLEVPPMQYFIENSKGQKIEIDEEFKKNFYKERMENQLLKNKWTVLKKDIELILSVLKGNSEYCQGSIDAFNRVNTLMNDLEKDVSLND